MTLYEELKARGLVAQITDEEIIDLINKGGVAMMAIRGGAKLMPIYIGTKKRLFAPVPIIFGKPFAPEYTGRKGTAEEYQANADKVMRQAYALGGEAWT